MDAGKDCASLTLRNQYDIELFSCVFYALDWVDIMVSTQSLRISLEIFIYKYHQIKGTYIFVQFTEPNKVNIQKWKITVTEHYTFFYPNEHTWFSRGYIWSVIVHF